MAAPSGWVAGAPRRLRRPTQRACGRLPPPADTLSGRFVCQTTARDYDARVAVLSKGVEAAERRREAEAEFVAATESLLARGSSYADLSVEQISAAAGRRAPPSTSTFATSVSC